MPKSRTILILSAMAIGTLAYGPAASADSSALSASMGHGLAERLCTNCHLVEPGQTNPPGHIGGPAFHTVADRPDVTEKFLRKHLRTTHSNAMIPLAMPNPQLTEDELVKIIDYVISLRPKQ